MRKSAGTQVAIVNGGGIRAPLSKGTLTPGDMYTILPFDNNVVTMKVTGAKLKELIQHGINPDGFGWGQYSGLTVWYDSSTDEITSMRLSDGTKIEDNEYYTLTSIDFLMTGGDNYNFDGHIEPVVIGEMRDIIINEWKNGIDELNYNLLIDGEDTTIDKPEIKPEVKPETKPEVKPEEKPEINPETKPEVKPEIKPEVKPEVLPSEGENSENKNDKLPQTGEPISPTQVIFIALALSAVGVLIIKKKENVA